MKSFPINHHFLKTVAWSRDLVNYWKFNDWLLVLWFMTSQKVVLQRTYGVGVSAKNKMGNSSNYFLS